MPRTAMIGSADTHLMVIQALGCTQIRPVGFPIGDGHDPDIIGQGGLGGVPRGQPALAFLLGRGTLLPASFGAQWCRITGSNRLYG